MYSVTGGASRVEHSPGQSGSPPTRESGQAVRKTHAAMSTPQGMQVRRGAPAVGEREVGIPRPAVIRTGVAQAGVERGVRVD